MAYLDSEEQVPPPFSQSPPPSPSASLVTGSRDESLTYFLPSKRSERLTSPHLTSAKFIWSFKYILHSGQSSTMLTFLFILFFFFSFIRGTTSVTVHEVRILSDSGKSDFVIAGEGVTLSCLFMLDPGEVLESVVWEKDKEQVYVYIKDKLDPPAEGGLLKGHIDLSNNSPSTLIIKNVTKDMQGTYSCNVKTHKHRSQNEAFLIVILDACKESSWETHSDMVSCTEDITFYCRGMFPKPSPVCGIYNDITGSYVQSVPFDRVDKMEDGTYEISLFRRLHAKDWLKYPGQLSFRCFMIIMSTTWRRGIHHKLFGDAGCVGAVPNVHNGYYNSSLQLTCWNTPREGSKVYYSCNDGYDLSGPEGLVCRNGTWKSLPSSSHSTTNAQLSASTRKKVHDSPNNGPHFNRSSVNASYVKRRRNNNWTSNITMCITTGSSSVTNSRGTYNSLSSPSFYLNPVIHLNLTLVSILLHSLIR